MVLRGGVSNRVGHEYRLNWSESRLAVNGWRRLGGWTLAKNIGGYMCGGSAELIQRIACFDSKIMNFISVCDC
uniref:Uncharacterized protein n=1 Tax=Romanomermis culicivorax TaxID=13658 RepID=A0A915L9N4_ROMCU